MIRLYRRHQKRHVQNLDGVWKFKTDPGKKGLQEEWYRAFPYDCRNIAVPSCWNNELGLRDYEGVAWFTTTFITSKRNVNLVFHAVTGQADVYLDGVRLGGHYGSFTCFNFAVGNLEPGEHFLAVSVDNSLNDSDTFPLRKVDWFNYGGIIRSVEIMELDESWIKNYQINYQLDENMKNAVLEINLTLEGLDSNVHMEQLCVYINDHLFYTSDIQVQGEKDIKITGISLENIRLWGIGQPNLYYVRIETGKDDIVERIGFRLIKAENGKIMLNGEKIFIKGVNRHEDHPDWGFAIPLKIMSKDIDIIKNLGCNAIRGSHYPNAESFLDYCDQEGLLFWEEIPMWQYFEMHLENPVVMERGLKMLEEMVQRDYHHPCIIIWGMHNEIDTTIQAAHDLTAIFSSSIRSMDATRLITYASSRPMEDICFSFADIICVNKYFEWYEGVKEDWVVFLDNFKEKLKNEGLRDRPVIISEFGVEAISGETGFEGNKWTENYQEKYLSYTLNLFLNDPDVSGFYIWQYCDVLSSDVASLLRPRGYNNKGIVNEYRKPKMAYWTVRKVLELPYIMEEGVYINYD